MPCILHAMCMPCICMPYLCNVFCTSCLCHGFAYLISPFSCMPCLLKANYTISAHRCMENRFVGLHCHSSRLTHRVLPITHLASFVHWLLITHCSLFVAYHALLIVCCLSCIAHCLLLIMHCLLLVATCCYHALLIICRVVCTACYIVLIMQRSLFTARHSLLVVCCLYSTAHYLLLIVNCSLFCCSVFVTYYGLYSHLTGTTYVLPLPSICSTTLTRLLKCNFASAAKFGGNWAQLDSLI